MPDEQDFQLSNEKNKQQNEDKDDLQSPEVTEAQIKLFETHRAAGAIIGDLIDFKKNLIPSSAENTDQVPLEEALAFVSSFELQQDESEDLNWELTTQFQSRLMAENDSLSNQIGEITDQLYKVESDLNSLDWEQQNRRDSLKWEKYLEEEPLSHKISSKIKGAFLGIKEYRESFSKRYLENERENLTKQREDLRSQLQKIREATKKINQFIAEQVSDHIENEAEKLVGLWDQLAEDLADSNWVNEELTQTIIADDILPTLERKQQEGKFTEEEKNKFLEDLSAYIRARNAGDVEEQNSLLAEIHNQYSIYTNVRYEIQLLSSRDDQAIVKEMVAHLAYEQLSKFKQEFVEDLPDRIARDLSNVLGEKLKIARRYFPGWNPQTLFDSEEINVKVKDFDLLKKSETAQKIFGPIIKELDRHIYQVSMDQALIDTEGEFIDNLAYYPTPDAIKTLVIIAAADQKSYRTSHANTSLTRLARSEDWGIILNHAIETYPELAELSEVLLNWAFKWQHNNPEARAGAQALAMRVLQSEEEDPRLKAMAQESLNNNLLAVELAKNGVISQEDAVACQQAYELLFKFADHQNQESDAMETDQTIDFKLHLNIWNYEVRKILKNLNEVDSNDARYAKLQTVFQNLVHLGEMWQEVQEDQEKLFFLSSSFIVDIVVKDNEKQETVTQEQLSFLKTAYDTHPFLQDDSNSWILNIIKSNPVYFLNESRMNSLQQLYDQYGKLELIAAETISRLVSNEEISLERALVLPQEAPDLLEDKTALSFPELFLVSSEANRYGRDFLQRYRENGVEPKAITRISSLVRVERISPERALELPEKALYLLGSRAALSYPELFLIDDNGVEFGMKFIQAYREEEVETLIINQVAWYISNENISKEQSLDFIEILPNIFTKETEDLRKFIFDHSELIASNPDDLKFLSRFIGTHGKQTLVVLKDYVNCLESGVVDQDNRNEVLEFSTRFRALSPTIVEGYLEARNNGLEDVYVADLQQMSEQMVSSEPLSESDREKPYYHDLLRAVYANNSGKDGGYEKTKACSDRSSDLAEFSYEPKYEIDLLAAAELKLKDGEALNEAVVESLKADILSISQEMNELDYDLEKIQARLDARVDQLLAARQAQGKLEKVDLEQLNNIDEKIFILLVDAIYGDAEVPSDELKELVLRYEFAFFDDIRDYIQGTSDRVHQAPNQDYAMMCELHSFFADRIKEINRRLVRKGWENPALQALMPEYFAQVSQERARARFEDQVNRLRIDRLGMSQSFFEQIGRTVERRMGKKYPPETIRRLITYYENLTEGLTVETTSDKGLTKAFYGQLRAQRAKTMEAVEAITGDKVDPREFHLGEISLEDLAISLAEINTGQYDEEQFQAFAALRFLNLFADERNLLEEELAKFESESGKERQVINGYFTKTKESANARMVGGVCVSKDNPRVGQSHEQQQPNMWDDEHYFQLVLQDPETARCQGLVLLHHFEENGEKVLAAAPNPSSTFLYSTDEKSVFAGLLETLIDFALANGFDKIVISQNKNIRTNRTGGEFEKAMIERVKQVGKTFSFQEEKDFSYNPVYKIKDMDVIWER